MAVDELPFFMDKTRISRKMIKIGCIIERKTYLYEIIRTY